MSHIVRHTYLQKLCCAERGADSAIAADGSERLSDCWLSKWREGTESVRVQVVVEDKAAAGRGGTVVQRLAVSRHHPLMVTATASGTVLLYDLRSPRAAAASLRPHSAPIVGALLHFRVQKD